MGLFSSKPIVIDTSVSTEWDKYCESLQNKKCNTNDLTNKRRKRKQKRKKNNNKEKEREKGKYKEINRMK